MFTYVRARFKGAVDNRDRNCWVKGHTCFQISVCVAKGPLGRSTHLLWAWPSTRSQDKARYPGEVLSPEAAERQSGRNEP